MKLSVSSYSFSQELHKENMTQKDVVKKAGEMGFAGVEFTTLTPCPEPTLGQQLDYAAEIREEAQREQMQIVAYTFHANLWQEDNAALGAEIQRVKDQIDVAEALGTSLVRHDLIDGLTGKGSGRSFLTMMPALAQATRELTEYAGSKGIRTCTENHGYVSQDSTRMEQFAALVNHDNYGLLVDMGNFLCVDEDPSIAVSRVAPYAFHVHAKDMMVYPGTGSNPGNGCIRTRAGSWLRCTIIGQGSVPIQQCLRALKGAGYDGWVTIEFEGCEDCLTGIRIGRENLKRYMEEL